jgi:thymidylate kinase
MKGKFIVIYGANNLGKSYQVDLLTKAFESKGIRTKRIKYPLYDLVPTGPLINAVLRKGKQMPEDELQKLYVQNRKDYEPSLKSDLKKGIWVLAEDYKGTGIAWGMVRGVALDYLEEINRGLYPEDIAFVFYGKRFATGIESNHRNEQDERVWEKAHQYHLELADKYGWIKVHANRPHHEVHQEILSHIEKKFSRALLI